MHENSDDYFKYMQHTGQRPVTPITLPHPAGLGDYSHTQLIGMCRTIFHLPMVSTKPCGQKAFSAN
jgi:hypothetical protein